jgi:hypothetical protein
LNLCKTHVRAACWAQRSLKIMALVLLLASISVPVGAQGASGIGDQSECLTDGRQPNLDVPNLALNCPDLYAWLQFIEVNAPAASNPDAVTWELWTTDPLTFPAKPAPKRCGRRNAPANGCPVWPSSVAQTGLTLPSKRNPTLHPPSLRTSVKANSELGDGVPRDLGAIATETVRRNRTAFDYIVAHDLWYQEGLAARFKEGFKIDFPLESVELKFNWLPMTYVKDPSRYFTTVINGELQGLVAMHVSTKTLPNWFWSTFEHVDNPGRCDYIGCFDSFGSEPRGVPNKQALQTRYTPGRLTPELERLMSQARLDPVFRNYRLKGSQTDFTDSMGQATILGNSVTEYGFVPTASCITCHGRAGVDWNGKKPANLRIFGEKLSGQTFNGPLDPELFYDGDPSRRYLMQVDFVWAIPFRAQPIGGGK